MIRSIISVISGSALWTVLWLGYNAALKKIGILSFDGTTRFDAAVPLCLLIAGSVVFSVVAGFVTTAFSRSNGLLHAWILAFLQLAFGIVAEVQYWHLLPFWYHALFLLLLVPATLLGGYLQVK